jgi:hypothetical protein
MPSPFCFPFARHRLRLSKRKSWGQATIMEFIQSTLDWYMANSDYFTPIVLAVFIIGLSLGIVQLMDGNQLRTGLIFPVAVALFVLGFVFTSSYGRELYFNLATEFLMAIVTLLIVVLATQLESWTIPLVGVAVLAFILAFFVDPTNVQSSIGVNMATGLIGAWLTAYLIRKEWSFSPEAREKRLGKALRATRQAREKQEAEMGDYFMLIAGSDEGLIKQRIDFLKSNDMEIVNEGITEQDEETKLYYKLINAKILTVVKNPDRILLSNTETRVQILGYQDSVKKVFKQIDEVLEVGEQKRIEAPDPAMVNIEFKTTVPVQPYSAFLEAEIFKLAREWQYGEDVALQEACDNLLDWAKEMNLIKK